MFEVQPRPGATPIEVERALEYSKGVSDLIDQCHPAAIAVARPAVIVATALFMQVLEHRHAVIVLVHLGIRSSAAALIRPSFEALFRGVWALKAASEDQIQNIFKTDHPSVPPIKKVIEQLRRNKETRYLADWDFWQAGGDYVHSGPLQMNRWISRDGIEPLHTDRDAIVMLELSDLCALLASIEMCKSCSQSTTELEEKLSEHTLRRISQKAARVYFGTDDQ